MLNYTWRSAGSFVAPSSVSVTSSHRDVYQDKWVKKMCYIIQWNIGLCLVTQSYPTLCDPMDCSLPDFSVHRISRQEYWSGLPFPPLGDLDSGIDPRSPALWADSLLSEPLRKWLIFFFLIIICKVENHCLLDNKQFSKWNLLLFSRIWHIFLNSIIINVVLFA